MLSLGEVAGYLGALLVFATFYMRTMVPLRAAGIASNITFIAYGYMGHLYPVLVLHCILLPLNLYRLREMVRLTQSVRAAAQADLDFTWLKPFTKTKSVLAGEVLFERGDMASNLFFVLSGRFGISALGIELGAGEIIGELGLFNGGRKRTQTILCRASGKLLEIAYDDVEKLFYQNPGFGFYLMRLAASRLLGNAARYDVDGDPNRLASASTSIE
jgi:hypothetical protein